MSTAVQPSLANTAGVRISSRALSISLCVSALLILAGCFRSVSTYSTFAQTYDETAHIACGLEWWTFGTYTYEPQHPPLSRIAAGLGPYLLGLRSIQRPDRSFWAEGNRILYEGDYKRTLAAARWGTLPFYVLTCGIVWLWTYRLSGAWAAALAVFLFSSLPAVLAHASLAATDLAACFGFTAAAFTVDQWLERPSKWRSILAGAGIAAAITTKFSTLLFLAIAIPILVLLRHRNLKMLHFRALAAVTLSACLLVWATYRFSLVPITGLQNRPHSIVTKVLGPSGFLADLGNRLVEMPVPGSEIAKGLVWAGYHGVNGHPAFFMGEHRTHGWWLFFPAVLLIKTPLPFFLLLAAGVFVLRRHRRLWSFHAAPLWAALGVLTVCVCSTVNLGIRHILPIYPLFAVIAGAGVLALAQSRGWLLRTTAVLLTASLSFSSLAIHPDYLAYFNVLAGSSPEEIVAGSDMDWGQDLYRLADWTRANNIPELTLGFVSSADVERHGLPPFRTLEPYQPVKGWVAVSVTFLKLTSAGLQKSLGRPDGPYDWLNSHKPVAQVGKCIRIYYINQ